MALVQSRETTVAATASTTLAFSSNVTAGNCVVVTTACFGSAVNLHSDNVAGTYKPGVNQSAPNPSLRTDYFPNHPGGATTVTIDPTGTGDVYVVISEWSNVDTIQPFDMAAAGGSTGSSTTASAGSTGTLTDADSTIYAAMTHGGADISIAEDSGDGFTIVQENELGSSSCPGAVQYKVVSATTAVTPDWTLGSSAAWTAHRLVLRKNTSPFPYLIAAGALSANASGTTITTTIPSGAQADDVMLLALMCNGSTTFSQPTDWTLLGTSVESNANQSTEWYWKRHDGSESNPASTTSATLSTTVGGYGRIYLFRNCLTSGDPFEDVTMNGTPTSSTTPATAAIDTTDTNRLAVGLVMVDDDNTWSSGNPPSSWAACGTLVSSATGGDAMMDAIQREVPTATTVAAATIGTMSAADFWRTLTLALIPAATGGGPQTITVDTAALTLGGQQPTLSGSGGTATIAADVAVFTLTGVQPTLSGSGGTATVAADTAALALAGRDVTIQLDLTFTLDTATLTLTGQQPTLSGSGDATIAVDPATLTLTGVQPSLSAGDTVVSVDTATLTLTGQDPTVSGSGAASIPVDPATLTLTGVQVTIVGADITINVDTATLTLAGQQATLTGVEATIPVDSAALALTGQQVTLSPTGAASIAFDPAALALVGVDIATAGSGSTATSLDTALLTLLGVQVAAIAGITAPIITGRLTLTDLTPDRSLSDATPERTIDDVNAVRTMQDVTP